MLRGGCGRLRESVRGTSDRRMRQSIRRGIVQRRSDGRNRLRRGVISGRLRRIHADRGMQRSDRGNAGELGLGALDGARRRRGEHGLLGLEQRAGILEVRHAPAVDRKRGGGPHALERRIASDERLARERGVNVRGGCAAAQGSRPLEGDEADAHIAAVALDRRSEVDRLDVVA